MRRFLLLLLLLSLPGLLRAQRPLALTGVTMLDGIGKKAVPDVIIVIDRGVIVGVGEREFVIIPPDAEVVDLRGKFVMPGMVDVHVHAHEAADLRSMFAWGVTSINCMFGSTDEAAAMERMTAADTAPLPRIFPTAPMFAADAAWYEGVEPDTAITRCPQTPEEAREQVRKAKAKGMTRIELLDDGMEWGRGALAPRTRLTPEVRAALIDEAAQQGMKSAVHASRFAAAEEAQLAGAFAFNTGIIDEHLSSTFISLMPTKPEFYVPTLSRYAFYADVAGFVRRVLADRRFRVSLPEALVTSLTSSDYASRIGEQVPNGASLTSRQSLLRDNMTAVINNYGSISLGTDLPVFPGIAAHIELEEMVKGGLTPMQALAVATALGGQYLGASAGVGIIFPGGKADLLVLDADPRADIRNTRSIRTVIKGGVRFDHRKLLEQAKR